MGEIMRSRSKSILKYAAIFSGTEAMGLLCGIIRVKVIAVLVGAAGIGLLALLSYVFDMAVAMLSGLKTAGVREIASGNDAETRCFKMALVRRMAVYTGSVCAVSALLLSPLFSYIALGSATHWGWFAALSVGVLLTAFSVGESASLQGAGQYGTLAFAGVVAPVVSVSLVCAAVWMWHDTDSVAAVIPLGAMGAALVYIIAGIRNRSIMISAPSRRAMHMKGGSLLRMSLAVAASGFVGQLTGYSVVSFIRHNGGVEAVGVYQAGYTIVVKYVGVILAALAVEYFPRISSRPSGLKSIEVIMRHESMVFIPILTSGAVLLALFAPETVAILYAPGFMSAADMVLFALPSLSVRILSWNIAFIVLAKGSPQLFMTMECIGSAIMAGSVLCGYIFGGIAGAGVGIAFESFIYMAMVYAIVRNRYGITPGRKLWIACAISFMAIMGAVAVRMFYVIPD